MLRGGLMDRAHTPTFVVIAYVPDADKWSNGWCTFSQFFSDRLGGMLPNGLMDRAHALSSAVVVSRKPQ